MRLWNLNPAPDIGASAWLVETDDHRLLLDAGTHPKHEGHAGLPLLGRVRDFKVDAIAISHCHHDHVGSLPVAMRYFPEAHVLLPELSYFLIERVLHNSVNVMQRKREELGLREYPLYTHNEVDDLAARFQGYRYGREVEWAALQATPHGAASPTLEFYDAGHTLGSAGIMVRGERESLFYSGMCRSAIRLCCAVRVSTTWKRTCWCWRQHEGTGRSRPGSIERRNRSVWPKPSSGFSSAGECADPGLRPRADTRDPWFSGVADAGGTAAAATRLHRRAWPGVYRDLRS
ncbi:MAG: MBL fold metallo-hydrolase [Verrucomicrobia bacterium]|nr:MBL fold metallo-hydrolase [Verrucomicrobiota bacterium]